MFATIVAHRVHLRDAFNEAGAVAEHLDGTTPADERDAILKRLETAAQTSSSIVNVLREGYDLPDIGCIVLARPTKSFGLYRQMVGRGLRTEEGKACCIVIDHAGATKLHGYVEEPVEWSLDTSRRAESKVKAATRGQFHQRQMRNCPECDALGWEGKPCRDCGWRPIGSRSRSRSSTGISCCASVASRPIRSSEETDERREFYDMLLGYADDRRLQARGFAFHKYLEKFGEKPPWSWRNDAPLRPTPEVERWVRSRFIAWHKGQAKAARSSWQGRRRSGYSTGYATVGPNCCITSASRERAERRQRAVPNMRRRRSIRLQRPSRNRQFSLSPVRRWQRPLVAAQVQGMGPVDRDARDRAAGSDGTRRRRRHPATKCATKSQTPRSSARRNGCFAAHNANIVEALVSAAWPVGALAGAARSCSAASSGSASCRTSTADVRGGVGTGESAHRGVVWCSGSTSAKTSLRSCARRRYPASAALWLGAAVRLFQPTMARWRWARVWARRCRPPNCSACRHGRRYLHGASRHWRGHPAPARS